ncbi:bifunctional methylenetetrahydrofolate dehydrogenase/methenyltetrahydrofolate cyclohydrolase FolD [Elioraea tepidiphila]|jgi:methylenetetrahydrofolate dehydrogenase (NADP+)/methenyltetrahydrofolate cyclohydrolase|uniref:bifunctional methylenetetrahydrofolate dehydrogenase/methenyltetrahydrofolate cyclohydrolase FolD n=1 Tax=Elioraea tepidiphila TaxID=457934 RepID=UPI000379ED80|nr:bifunctional methylenetetrahydrofolate dehydrogenase/methenyltetrahydrofolate cyclohydrolase FolD [Elioraea tepidiphila]
MSAAVIDGRAAAARLRARVAAEARGAGIVPGLTVVIVGDDPASRVYVRNKTKAAATAGFRETTIALPAETSEPALLQVIARLNADDAVDGILVQLPLPKHIRTQAVIEALDPAKDVDGLHPLNAGHLAGGHPRLVPCTPKGVMTLLAEAGVALAGARAVVLGRSTLVGRPVAALLTGADATVTLAHSRTRDLAAECRRAEVLVVAVGRAELVRGDWIAEGATVIDVGINRRADGRLVGDVAFAEAAERAAWITPVPGGVGPMTIASLLENTLIAAKARRGFA